MRSREAVDVAIVGASVAGSALAIRLGREDLNVALIDKAVFPRRKVCGEGLSRVGVSQVRELGLSAEFNLLPKHPFYGYTVWCDRRPYEMPFALPNESLICGFGVPRLWFDQMLLSEATKFSNVSSYLGYSVTGIERVGDRFVVRTESRTFEARFVVLANGGSSPLSTRLGIPLKQKGKNRYAHSFVAAGTYSSTLAHVHIIAKPTYEICCTPTGPEIMNISVLGDKRTIGEIVKFKLQPIIFDEVRQRTGFRGEPSGPGLSIGPIGRYSRHSPDPRLLLVGDCLEHLDPIGGMGMTHALLSASRAANMILSIDKEMMSEREALARYVMQRETAARPLRGFTRLTYFALKHLGERGFHLLGNSPIPRALSASANGNSTAWLARMIISAAGFSTD